MDLLKKNLHMDRVQMRAVCQITLEDDMNLPEQKPDVNSLNFQKGSVVIDEIRPGTDCVNVRGRLIFDLLYHTQEGGCSLVGLGGKIPFDEKINLQGKFGPDEIQVEGCVEDLSVGVINSRKLNVQSVITLNCRTEELYDEEIPMAIQGEETVEYRRVAVPAVRIAICKNDIFRVKEEMHLPGNTPNIFQILYSNVTLEDMDFRVMEEAISLSGEMRVFVLYEGEGEDHPVRSFEHSVPIAGKIDCHGSKEHMIPEIRCAISGQDHGIITVKPDYDGEERCLLLETVLDISMKLYEEEQLEMVTDIYGVSKEVETVMKPCVLRNLLSRVNAKMRISEHVRAQNPYGILQLLHSEGMVSIEEQEAVEGGILLRGSLLLNTVYITGDDAAPYGGFSTRIPFQYLLEIPGIRQEDMGTVRGETEKLQVTMLDGEEMDVKAVLSFSTTAFRSVPMQIVTDVKVKEADSALLGKLPGMVIYTVKPGDNLWSIGRKYYVPVESIRKINQLENEELKAGQRLLVVRGL